MSEESGGVGPGDDAVARAKRQRSVSYPAFGLEEAISKAKAFYNAERLAYVPGDAAIKSMGLAPTGSTGMRALAALTHFGLLEDDPKGGPSRRVGLSDLGRTLVLAPAEHTEDRERAIATAALNPKLYRTLWDRYAGKLPSDSTLEYDLVRTIKFNPESVKGFIKDFRATVALAKLGEAAIVPAAASAAAPLSPPGGEADPLREKSPGVKGKEMPSLGQVDSPTFDLPVPLLNGETTTLRMPRFMSNENYEYMVSLIDVNLKAIKKAIVREGPGEDA